MVDKLDVNNYQGKLKREISNITERDEDTGEWRIPREVDRNDLALYAGDIEAELSASTAGDDIARMRRLAEIMDKPLRDCSVDDIKLGMKKLAEKNLGEGRSYKSGSRRKVLQAANRFGESRDIGALKEIEVPSVKIPKVDPDKYPTKAEFWELIEHADTRDKAMIAVMWECPSRITAFLSLKIKDYETPNEEYGLLTTPTNVEGLKGADGREKPLTISRGYLDRWLADHPCRDDPDAALFCRMDKEKHYGKHMSGQAVRNRLNRLMKKVDWVKPVNPHAFRHSRASYMKKSDRYDDMHIEQVMDWSPGSQQHKRYEHLKQKDKVNSILRARGVEPEDDDMDPEDMDCPGCLRSNIPWDARQCPYCGLRVDDAPADWWSIYTRIVDADDPVRRKYGTHPTLTPAFAALSPRLMKHVRHQMGRAVAISDQQGYPYRDLTQDEIDRLARMWLDYGAVAKSAEENEAEWELMDDDEFDREELEWYAEQRDEELKRD